MKEFRVKVENLKTGDTGTFQIHADSQSDAQLKFLKLHPSFAVISCEEHYPVQYESQN